jgi:DNA primase
LVEGIFDALAVIQAGFLNVVALLGAIASPCQHAAISSFRQILSLLDADDAEDAEDAGGRGATLLRSILGRRVTVVALGNGDPGNAGAGRVRAALTGYVPAR